MQRLCLRGGVDITGRHFSVLTRRLLWGCQASVQGALRDAAAAAARRQWTQKARGAEGEPLQQLSSLPLPSPLIRRPFAAHATWGAPWGAPWRAPHGSHCYSRCSSSSSSSSCFGDACASRGRLQEASRFSSHTAAAALSPPPLPLSAAAHRRDALPALAFRADTVASLLPRCGLVRLLRTDGLLFSADLWGPPGGPPEIQSRSSSSKGRRLRGAVNCSAFDGLLCPDSLRCLLFLFTDLNALLSLQTAPQELLFFSDACVRLLAAAAAPAAFPQTPGGEAPAAAERREANASAFSESSWEAAESDSRGAPSSRGVRSSDRRSFGGGRGPSAAQLRQMQAEDAENLLLPRAAESLGCLGVQTCLPIWQLSP
ncbi:hypothetical protein cyc_07706 [Cyclospora cayetanensis]|uniref:Uncharacterized protein n=1 Tax=Cyclospora cayetanensis TaxID=88456 RepID=A0A1D3D9X7_9EIME|nr:hypothetical protein cyc_07706 [Cyclospora cayetanensis]